MFLHFSAGAPPPGAGILAAPGSSGGAGLPTANPNDPAVKAQMEVILQNTKNNFIHNL